MNLKRKRQALGQHFLKDMSIAKLICEVGLQKMKLHQCQALLEIGPGQGALTHLLLKSVSQAESFMIVEKDPHWASYWQSLDTRQAMTVKAADFLELHDVDWLQKTPLAVISNLPYASSLAILKKCVDRSQHIPVMVLMFQAEVARRLRAEDHKKVRLSVWIQNQWAVEKILFVSPQAFSPPPQVNSEVLCLTRLAEPRVPGSVDHPLWLQLLTLSFSQRRQMLRRVLKSSPLWLCALEQSQIDTQLRAEALTWGQWCQLFQCGQRLSQASGYRSHT